MSDYDDVVESALIEEEQAIEQAEEGGQRPDRRRLAKYLSVYIASISLVVAVAALLTAFAADQWMDDSLEEVADNVDLFTLRVETRCNEIQRDLALMAGRPLNDALDAEMRQTAADLAALERDRARVDHDAALVDRAHYVLATAITFLQMATAMAAVSTAIHRRELIYASSLFAVFGVALTVFGVGKFIG